jgi:hypothetical protein
VENATIVSDTANVTYPVTFGINFRVNECDFAHFLQCGANAFSQYER